MKIIEMHKILNRLNSDLTRVFKTDLELVDKEAMLCYLLNYSKFTISLFIARKKTNTKPKEEFRLENEHLVLLSEYPIDNKVIKILENITEYITKDLWWEYLN